MQPTPAQKQALAEQLDAFCQSNSASTRVSQRLRTFEIAERGTLTWNLIDVVFALLRLGQGVQESAVSQVIRQLWPNISDAYLEQLHSSITKRLKHIKAAEFLSEATVVVPSTSSVRGRKRAESATAVEPVSARVVPCPSAGASLPVACPTAAMTAPGSCTEPAVLGLGSRAAVLVPGSSAALAAPAHEEVPAAVLPVGYRTAAPGSFTEPALLGLGSAAALLVSGVPAALAPPGQREVPAARLLPGQAATPHPEGPTAAVPGSGSEAASGLLALEVTAAVRRPELAAVAQGCTAADGYAASTAPGLPTPWNAATMPMPITTMGATRGHAAALAEPELSATLAPAAQGSSAATQVPVPPAALAPSALHHTAATTATLVPEPSMASRLPVIASATSLLAQGSSASQRALALGCAAAPSAYQPAPSVPAYAAGSFADMLEAPDVRPAGHAGQQQPAWTSEYTSGNLQSVMQRLRSGMAGPSDMEGIITSSGVTAPHQHHASSHPADAFGHDFYESDHAETSLAREEQDEEGAGQQPQRRKHAYPTAEALQNLVGSKRCPNCGKADNHNACKKCQECKHVLPVGDKPKAKYRKLVPADKIPDTVQLPKEETENMTPLANAFRVLTNAADKFAAEHHCSVAVWSFHAVKGPVAETGAAASVQDEYMRKNIVVKVPNSLLKAVIQKYGTASIAMDMISNATLIQWVTNALVTAVSKADAEDRRKEQVTVTDSDWDLKLGAAFSAKIRMEAQRAAAFESKLAAKGFSNWAILKNAARVGKLEGTLKEAGMNDGEIVSVLASVTR